MSIHLRPVADNDPGRHTLSRHCTCQPKVTIQPGKIMKGTLESAKGPLEVYTEGQVVVEHRSDIPWTWGAQVRKV